MESNGNDEKPVSPLKTKALETVDALKAEIETLKAKNALLVEDLKFQVVKLKVQLREFKERVNNSKAALATKSLWGKFVALFKDVEVVPKKRILATTIADETICLMGYILQNKRAGYVVVREAKIVDFTLGDPTYFIKEGAGNVYISISKIDFICDPPM